VKKNLDPTGFRTWAAQPVRLATYFKFVSSLKVFHPDGTWRLSMKRESSTSKQLCRKTDVEYEKT
jgi:hypothetical protein